MVGWIQIGIWVGARLGVGMPVWQWRDVAAAILPRPPLAAAQKLLRVWLGPPISVMFIRRLG